MFLKVHSGRAEEVAYSLKEEALPVPSWDYEGIYLQSNDFEELASYFLVLNSINYCFFHPETKTSKAHTAPHSSGLRFSDGKMSGATLAARRVTLYWDRLQDPLFLAHIDANMLATEIFKAPVPIPMVEDRAASLREAGQFLSKLKKEGQTLRMFIDSRDGDAYRIAEAIAQEMPVWQDPFLKRAQLFVGMLYGRCQHDEDCPFKEESLARLTVFADYRLPQTLIALGILVPNPSLSRALARHELIPANARSELEIRAGTIVGADELIRSLNYVRQNDRPVNALHVDYLLWRIARETKSGDGTRQPLVRAMPEHHRTYTTHY